MLIVLKVLLAPVLVGVCTLAVHRWGAVAGGWMLGLPLISGPVSVLLWLEHGSFFARRAAEGTLLGFAAAAAFYTCYMFVARRQSWWKSLLAGVAACAATAAALAGIHPTFEWSMAIVLTSLVVLAAVAGMPQPPVASRAPRAGQVLGRMAAVGAVVYLVTTGAGLMGPSLAGVLAPLPLIAGTMASSVHRSSGREAAGNLLRGAVAGCWGGVAFFLVVGFMMEPGQAVHTYMLATAAALIGALVASALPSAAPHVRRLALAAFTG